MTNFGIEIGEKTVDVQEALPEEFVFSSEYKSLRVSSRDSGVINSSVDSGLVTIPHNLGYVPAFLVHVDPTQTNNYYIAPYIPSGIFGTPLIQAYADETNLYIKAIADTLTQNFYASDDQYNYAFEYNGLYGAGGVWYAGAASLGPENGALRFSNVYLDNAQSNIISARLKFYVAVRTGSALVKLTIKGIDEDNTALFNSGTAAFGRSRTTASLSSNTNFTTGQYSNEDVKNIVEEIINRAGWVNGNAMGFILDDNGTTPATNDYKDDYSLGSSYLEVISSTPTVANYKYTIFLNRLQ